jgi:DNA-binding NarL/FixJ family response regulator
VIRVAVVAEVRLYRDGIAQALERDPRFEVVVVAGTSAEGIALIAERLPDVALVDLATRDGPALVRALLAEAPEVFVVTLGVDEDEDQLLPLAEAGMAGYVSREGSLDDLLATMESVSRGESLCSPRIAAALLRRVAALAGEHRRPEPAPLTAREQQVLALVEQGLSNKQIARALTIQVPTVKNHVHTILEKLQVSRRGEAAALLRRPRD